MIQVGPEGNFIENRRFLDQRNITLGTLFRSLVDILSIDESQLNLNLLNETTARALVTISSKSNSSIDQVDSVVNDSNFTTLLASTIGVDESDLSILNLGIEVLVLPAPPPSPPPHVPPPSRPLPPASPPWIPSPCSPPFSPPPFPPMTPPSIPPSYPPDIPPEPPTRHPPVPAPSIPLPPFPPSALFPLPVAPPPFAPEQMDDSVSIIIGVIFGAAFLTITTAMCALRHFRGRCLSKSSKDVELPYVVSDTNVTANDSQRNSKKFPRSSEQFAPAAMESGLGPFSILRWTPVRRVTIGTSSRMSSVSRKTSFRGSVPSRPDRRTTFSDRKTSRMDRKPSHSDRKTSNCSDRKTSGSHPPLSPVSAVNNVEWNRFELVSWDRVSLGEFIGSGTSGDVYKAEYAQTEVACKLLRKRQVTEREIQILVDESQLMLKLRHPNVLLMIGITSDRVMNHGILTELMDLSLDALITSTSIEPQPTWVSPFSSIALDVARGMAYLHEHRVLHRDLKPGNVLLKLPHMLAKVADFGTSRDVANGPNTSMTMTMAGTPVFMAPEVIRQDRYGKEADVWSFGGLLVHIATREPPYAKLLQRIPPYALMQAIAQGDVKPTTDVDLVNPDWPDAVAELAERCASGARDARPSFEEIAIELQRVVAITTASEDRRTRWFSRGSPVSLGRTRDASEARNFRRKPPISSPGNSRERVTWSQHVLRSISDVADRALGRNSRARSSTSRRSSVVDGRCSNLEPRLSSAA